MLEILIIVLAYLIGSVSSAVIVCKIMRVEDPRTRGSNNPGATNVLRLYGRKAAIPTLLGDMLKGYLPVMLAHVVDAPAPVIALTALAAFLGHLFPLYFRFHGGKGIATFFGVLTGIHWLLGLSFAGTWLLIAFLFRYSSLAGLLSAAITLVYVGLWLPHPAYLASVGAMTVLMFWRHRSNIRNLLAGREDKIGSKSGE